MKQHKYPRINTILFISCCLFITVNIVTCSNPVKPDTIWDIKREGDSIWFVKDNHTTITNIFKSNKYAYITVIDVALFGGDTPVTLLFTSAIGDTETVNFYDLYFNVPLFSEDSIGGTNIFLRNRPTPVIGDGALDVGQNKTEISAVYYHGWRGQLLKVTATVVPN